jgi:hypothetical protein
MKRTSATEASLRLINRWPKTPSRLVTQLRIAPTAPSQALKRRLAA